MAKQIQTDADTPKRGQSKHFSVTLMILHLNMFASAKEDDCSPHTANQLRMRKRLEEQRMCSGLQSDKSLVYMRGFINL